MLRPRGGNKIEGVAVGGFLVIIVADKRIWGYLECGLLGQFVCVRGSRTEMRMRRGVMWKNVAALSDSNHFAASGFKFSVNFG